MLHLARVADQSARYYLDDLGDELGWVAPLHGADAGCWIGQMCIRDSVRCATSVTGCAG